MTITQRVENILRLVPKTRDSDTELLLVYMQKAGLNLTDAQVAKFRDLPSFETITRVRRELQEHDRYPASPEVEKARFDKFKEVRGSIKGESAEKLLEQQGYKILPYKTGGNYGD